MTVKTNNAEGGTNGTAVTTANSGGTSGTAWDLVTGTAAFDTASAVHGSLGYKLTATSGALCLLRHTGFNARTGCVRAYITVDTLPASNEGFIRVATSGDVLVLDCGIRFISSASYMVRDAAGAVMAHTTIAPQAGDRIELSWTVGTTTSNGSWNFAVYHGDSTTAAETLSGTTNNLGTTNWAYVQYGKSTTSTWASLIHLDDVAAKDTDTTFFGVPVTNVAPTANAGPDQANIAAGATVTLDGSGSTDSDGTIASYAWTQTAGTTVTLSSTSAAQPTFTAPSTGSAQTLTFSLVVTDNLGATSTADTVNIGVLATPPVSNLKLRIGGVLVAAVEKVRIGGVLTAVTETILHAVGDLSVYSDTYSDTY